MLGPGNSYTETNAAKSKGLDKSVFLTVRKVFVELWDQKKD